MGTSFLIGALTSLACALLLRGWALRCRVVKKVGTPLVAHARELPPVGGLALALGGMAGAISWHLQGGVQWTDQVLGLLGACAVILAVGLFDDFVRELSPWQKLAGQAVAWLCLLRGGIVTQMVMLPTWADLLVSLVWTLAIINAMNLLDIADGLAGGIALIAAGTALLFSLLANQAAWAGLLAVLCGALVGVLVLNFPRATLFLGDSGSLLLGVLLAACTVAISYAPLGREVALLTPILVLGLPLYDLAFVTIVRARNGRSIFKKSADHFVFRLMRQGFSPTKAVLAMFGLGLAFSVTAVIVNIAPNLVGVITIGAVVVASLWWAVRMARIPTP